MDKKSLEEQNIKPEVNILKKPGNKYVPQNGDDIEEEKKEVFDFSEYCNELVDDASLSDDDRLPRLFLDDHEKRDVYKEGLRFYGYGLVAVPRPMPEVAYYIKFNGKGLYKEYGTFSYMGYIYNAFDEDYISFNRLLSNQSNLNSNVLVDYDLFFAPYNESMLRILRSKQKLL